MNRHRAALASFLMALLAMPVLGSWEDGVTAFRAGRYQDATSVFQSYVSSSPRAPEGHYMLGMSLLRQERFADALAPLGEAVSLSEDDIRYRMTLAQALLKAGKSGDAFDALNAQDPATVADASRASFNQLLARAATSSGRGGALASVDRALAVDQSSKPLWLARANLTARAGRMEEAYSALDTAFKLDPSDPQPGISAVHSALSIAQDPATGERKLEWYGKAAGVADRLAGAFPTPENLRLAGSANMGAKDYEGAIGYFEKLLASGDQSPLLHYDLGRCRQALGQHREALSDFAAALDRSPDTELTARVHSKRGAAHRALENFSGAAAAYRLAGDAEAAKEMDGYAQNRAEWAKAKDECSEKLTGLEKLLASSKDIEHTREYQELEREVTSMRSACEPYFNETS